MKVSVRLHAILRDRLPGGRGDIEVPEGATVSQLLDQLGVEEELREFITVNGSQIDDLGTAGLSDGDDVQVFPAVAGGSRSPYLDEGIRLFEKGEYFLSHETLEEHWIEAPEEDRNFYQGLIHLAVGFHHLERGNRKGAKLQFQKAVRRLESYADVHEGVDLSALRAFLAKVPGRIDRGEKVEPPDL